MILGLFYMILSGLTWVAIGAAVSDCTRHGGNYDALQGRFYLGFMIVTGAILPWCGILASPVPFRTLFAAGILYFVGGVANYCNYFLLARAMRLGHNGVVWSVMQAGVTQCCNNWPSYWSNATKIGSVFRSFFSMSGGFAGFLVAATIKPELRRPIGHRGTVLAGILIALSCLSYFAWFYHGLDRLTAAGAGSIGYPVSIGTCLIGFALYSFWILKEKMTAYGWAGITEISAGIILISIP